MKTLNGTIFYYYIILFLLVSIYLYTHTQKNNTATYKHTNPISENNNVNNMNTT